MHSERLDGMLTFAGCDKSLPGMLMAAARLNLPTVFLYGGTILPGSHNGKAIDITSVFEAVGACATGAMSVGGATFDANLVPRYLQNLTQEKVLAGARFDQLIIDRPNGKGANAAQVRFSASSLEVPVSESPAGEKGAT